MGLTTAELYERLGRYVELTIQAQDAGIVHDFETSIRRGVALVRAGRWDTNVWEENQ